MKQQRKGINQTTMVGVTTLVVILLVGIFCMYNVYIMEEIGNNVEGILEETLYQQAHNFNTQIVSDQESMALIAAQLSKYQDLEAISIQDLQDILALTTFDVIGVVDLNGDVIASNGVTTNVSDRDYFSRIMAKESTVEVVDASRITGDSVMFFASPLFHDGELFGSVIGTYKMEVLQALFLTSFGGQGYSYIVNDEGNILVKSQTDTALAHTNHLEEWFHNKTTVAKDNLSTILHDFEQNNASNLRFYYLGEERILQYTPLALEGWNMLTAIDKTIINEYAKPVVQANVYVSFALLSMLAVLLIFIYYRNKRTALDFEGLKSYDSITSSYTLEKFKREADKLLKQDNNNFYVIIKLDVADFKMINQTFGYETGNEALCIISDVMYALNDYYPNTIYSRFNTDEFICLIPMDVETDWMDYTRRIYYAILKKLQINITQTIRLPMGYYTFRKEEDLKLSQILERVNFAHRKAKVEAKDIVVFEDALETRMLKRNLIKTRLQHAIENQHFQVYLQPKVCLRGQNVVAAEALVRWISDEGTVYFPDEFIPVLEEDDGIVALDLFVFEQVCKTIADWIAKGYQIMPISVNISRNHLSNPQFVEQLLNITKRYQVATKYLDLELSEAIFVQELSVVKMQIDAMLAAGFMVSMDYFGSGYSSLGLLNQIPVTTLKLDKSFLNQNETTPRAQKIIAAVISLAQDLNIKTVAEGVETSEQMLYLQSLGCDEVQGYYYSRPIPIVEFTTNYLVDDAGNKAFAYQAGN